MTNNDKALADNLNQALGGRYEVADGRKFWMDEAVVEEMLKRIMPIITTPQSSADLGRYPSIPVAWGVFNRESLVNPWRKRADAEEDLREWKLNGKDHYDIRLLYSAPFKDNGQLASLRAKVKKMNKTVCPCSWPHCTVTAHNAALTAVLSEIDNMMKAGE